MQYLQATLNCNWRRRVKAARPGLLLAALGAMALLVAASLPFRLPSGRPGPGFVPMLVAGALVMLGLLLALAGARPAVGAPTASWRPGVSLCGAILAFGLVLPLGGFLPACWAAASLALVAAPGLGTARVVLGGGAVAAGAAAIFVGLLAVPVPLLGSR